LQNEGVVPGEIHQPAAIYRQTISHVVVSSIPRHGQESNIQNFIAHTALIA